MHLWNEAVGVMSGQMKRLFTEMYIEQLSVKHALNEWSSNQRELIVCAACTYNIFIYMLDFYKKKKGTDWKKKRFENCCFSNVANSYFESGILKDF